MRQRDQAEQRFQEKRVPRRISLADLVGSKIVTAEGKYVGHVVDAHLVPNRSYRVTELVYGTRAWLARLDVLGVLAGLVRPTTERHAPHAIPWEAVDRYERFVVYLKPGYEPDAK